MLEERDIEFLQAFWSKPVRVTYILFALNILIFILMEFAGGTTNETTLLAFGVKSNAEINQGEIWRFVTPLFIHIGLLHIFFNSYALWIVGPQVEKLYGSARFFIIYVMTGMAGVLGSYWYHPEAVSAGASGAIFGLFGALLVFGFKYRSSIPPAFQRAVGRGVLPVIVINLVIGFVIPAIDNSAHVGGLIAGAILAGIIPMERPHVPTHFFFKAWQGVLMVVVALSFYEVGAHYDGPAVSLGGAFRNWRELVGTGSSSPGDFVGAVNDAQEAFDDSVRELSSTGRTGIPAVRLKMAHAIERLKHIPSLGQSADRMSAEMLELSKRQYALLEDVERAHSMSFAQSDRARENEQRYNELMENFSKWVQTDGQKYGIQLRKQP